MIDYILEISFSPDLEDIIQGRLFLTRSTGNVAAGEGILEAYFDTSADGDAALASLRDLDVELRRVDRPRTDWLQLYQQSLQPIFAGRSFVIAPEESLIPRAMERHRLVIPQEQAFGTGSHESTALVIELLERTDLREKRGLDVGSGSGILALAMLRLGAHKVVAFDIDPDAFRPLRVNRSRNGVAAAEMPIFIGSLDSLRGGRFDVVTMNILPEVVVSSLAALERHVDGVLIVSGILDVQRQSVLDACARHRLGLVDESRRGEWWAGSFRVSS